LVTHEKLDFNIDEDRIYMWDKKKILYYEFFRMFKEENRKDISFGISEKDNQSSIKQVYSGDNSDTLAIVIE
jgi:hypothetical protein